MRLKDKSSKRIQEERNKERKEHREKSLWMNDLKTSKLNVLGTAIFQDYFVE